MRTSATFTGSGGGKDAEPDVRQFNEQDIRRFWRAAHMVSLRLG